MLMPLVPLLPDLLPHPHPAVLNWIKTGKKKSTDSAASSLIQTQLQRGAGLFSPQSFLKIIHVSHMPERYQITEESGFQKCLLFWSQHPESWVTCLDNSLPFEVYLNKDYTTSWFLFFFSQNCHMTTTNPIISQVGFIHQDFGDNQHLWMKKETK